EVGSTKTMLDRVKDRFDLHPERLIADTAYGTGPMLGWLVDRKIAPHIPVVDKSRRADGTWSRADFEWDPENDRYVCPEGQDLKQFRRNYSDPDRGPTDKGAARYRAIKDGLPGLPVEVQVLPERRRPQDHPRRARGRPPGRSRHLQDHAYVISMRLRKKVEMLFAHLKRILGLRRLRLRGPNGANDEFLLAATAQNLRKLAKIFPAPPKAATP
ncbi:MAG: transposase, partial [Jannaschia sp.]